MNLIALQFGHRPISLIDKMVLIREELDKILLLQEKVGAEFITSQMYKDQREWRTLGMFVNLLEQCQSSYPTYADKTEPPEPDFITFDDQKKEFKPVEIVEVLTPNRKRTKEYRESARIITAKFSLTDQVENPWSTFIQVLNDKFLKCYQRNCWLVVYHNVRHSEITMYGLWHEIILANVRKWIESKVVDFRNCPYEKIFVLDSSQRALVSINPSLDVLIPESR